MILESASVGPMEVNCYILASGRGSRAIIIDPGDQARKIERILEKNSLVPAFIINTHGHYDHIGCDDNFGVPVYIHSLDAPLLRDAQLNLSGVFANAYQVKSRINTVRDKDIIKLDEIQLEVLHMPGHTPGGMALRMIKPVSNIVFTGDSLFCAGVGRSDLAGGDEALLKKSIKEKLFTLPDNTIIYPGHGQSSTIDEEKKNNPFLT